MKKLLAHTHGAYAVRTDRFPGMERNTYGEALSTLVTPATREHERREVSHTQQLPSCYQTHRERVRSRIDGVHRDKVEHAWTDPFGAYTY